MSVDNAGLCTAVIKTSRQPNTRGDDLIFVTLEDHDEFAMVLRWDESPRLFTNSILEYVKSLSLYYSVLSHIGFRQVPTAMCTNPSHMGSDDASNADLIMRAMYSVEDIALAFTYYSSLYKTCWSCAKFREDRMFEENQ